MTIWVHGPSAWDTVIEVEEFPNPGDFLRAKSKMERPGGSGLNVALALASTDQEIGFVTYLGKDQHGDEIRKLLSSSGISKLDIQDLNAPTLHALIISDGKGERTIIALEQTYLAKLNLGQEEFVEGDIFIFTIWRDEFKPLLKRLQEKNVFTVVGAKAIDDPEVEADLVVGSTKDFLHPNPSIVSDRFEKLILTEGEKGSTLISKDREIHQPTLATDISDATGAGDAFLAGIALSIATGRSDQESLYLASAWSACTLSVDSSIPPSWSVVRQRWGLS